jgi:hypothetical protein
MLNFSKNLLSQKQTEMGATELKEEDRCILLELLSAGDYLSKGDLLTLAIDVSSIASRNKANAVILEKDHPLSSFLKIIFDSKSILTIYEDT